MLPYTLIRSKRRSLSLQINKHGELIARAPMRMSVDFIEDFIERKKDWIIKHQTRIQNQVSRIQRKEYSDREIQTMKQRLREYIIPRVQELWEGKNLPKYTNIKITKSEGRWGSCSAKNGLCFSYRLTDYLEVQPNFIDAIIIHELAHLKEKNHQKPFWNLVYSMMPEYEGVIKKTKNEMKVP